LDSVVDLADDDTEFELRLFLIPNPGSFVNIIEKLDIDKIREKDTLTQLHDEDRAF
jgi:chemotaxis protein CheC